VDADRRGGLPRYLGPRPPPLPSGQVVYVGGERFYCGVKNCFNEPSATAELYTPTQ
jgi:hypothetical protein